MKVRVMHTRSQEENKVHKAFQRARDRRVAFIIGWDGGSIAMDTLHALAEDCGYRVWSPLEPRDEANDFADRASELWIAVRRDLPSAGPAFDTIEGHPATAFDVSSLGTFLVSTGEWTDRTRPDDGTLCFLVNGHTDLYDDESLFLFYDSEGRIREVTYRPVDEELNMREGEYIAAALPVH